jgi:hypothetical protein
MVPHNVILRCVLVDKAAVPHVAGHSYHGKRGPAFDEDVLAQGVFVGK